MKTILKLAQNNIFDVVVHGQNCHCNMNGGIAAEISRIYPEVLMEDIKTLPGDKSKLGTINWVNLNDGFIIVNAYTQFDYTINKIDVNYNALRSCFKAIKNEFGGKRIGYPLIGCGVASGNWEIVSNIIDEELCGEDHTLVKWNGIAL